MRRIPFRWQLTLFIMLICGVTLSLAFVGLYYYDVQQFNTEVQQRLEKTRVVLVKNLVTLLAEKPNATELPLNLLGSDTQITAAAVYSAEGKLLASDIRTSGSVACEFCFSHPDHRCLRRDFASCLMCDIFVPRSIRLSSPTVSLRNTTTFPGWDFVPASCSSVPCGSGTGCAVACSDLTLDCLLDRLSTQWNLAHSS